MVVDYTMGMGKTIHFPALSPSCHTHSVLILRFMAQRSKAIRGQQYADVPRRPRRIPAVQTSPTEEPRSYLEDAIPIPLRGHRSAVYTYPGTPWWLGIWRAKNSEYRCWLSVPRLYHPMVQLSVWLRSRRNSRRTVFARLDTAVQYIQTR
jgi:hypothetical protein